MDAPDDDAPEIGGVVGEADLDMVIKSVTFCTRLQKTTIKKMRTATQKIKILFS